MLTFPMPSCSEVRRELEALALNDLPFRDEVVVRRHLERCTSCALAAREIAGVIRQLHALRAPGRRPAPRRVPVARVPVALAFAACVAIIILMEFRTGDRDTSPLPEESIYAVSAIGELIRAQGPDGAWRESGHDRSGALTVGLSGLATLGCLNASAVDPDTIQAGQLGCDFLAKTLAASPLNGNDAPPDLQLRAQAAAAWALGVAAERWPDRYRAVAARALRDLERLEDTWARPDAGLVLDDMTKLLLRSARGDKAVLRPEARDRAADGVSPTRLVTRLLASSEAPEASGPSLTRLASRVLADTLPGARAATF